MGVDCRLGRSSTLITRRIARSTDLLAVPRHNLGESLRHKPGRSFGIWMRSPKVFQGRRDCGQGLRAHLQVGGASRRSGPLDRDL
jgi:hypothetical protein